MSGLPVAPRRVFGVVLDVRADAGAHTWVCRGTPGPDGLRVESVDPLVGLPGGCIEREAAYRVLLTKILEAPRSVWGLDFPFGLPHSDFPPPAPPHLPAPWREAWLADLAGLQASADAARASMARRTERDLGVDATPAARVRTAVIGLLVPLLSQRSVAVLPFDALAVAPPGTPPQMLAGLPSIYLLEASPVAMRSSLGLAGADPLAALRALVGAQLVRPMPRALRQRIADAQDGRGLDAVLAAVAAWRGSRRDDHGQLTRDPAYGREGFIYC